MKKCGASHRQKEVKQYNCSRSNSAHQISSIPEWFPTQHELMTSHGRLCMTYIWLEVVNISVYFTKIEEEDGISCRMSL